MHNVETPNLCIHSLSLRKIKSYILRARSIKGLISDGVVGPIDKKAATALKGRTDVVCAVLVKMLQAEPFGR
jgi:hypothetical protein